MKSIINKLYLLLISIMIMGVFSCTVSNVEENKTKSPKESSIKNSEEGVIPFETVDLGKGNQALFYSVDGDKDFTMFLVANINHVPAIFNSIAGLTPVGIYEKYTGKKAPEKLVKVITNSGYKTFISKKNLSNLSNNGIQKMGSSQFETRWKNMNGGYMDHIVHYQTYRSATNDIHTEWTHNWSSYDIFCTGVNADMGMCTTRLQQASWDGIGDPNWFIIAGPVTLRNNQVCFGSKYMFYSGAYVGIRSEVLNANEDDDNWISYHHMVGVQEAR